MSRFIQYLLIVLISSLPLVSIFSTSLLPHTHDGFVHLARIAAYYKALSDGEFPVRWVGDLNFGYGMPLFIFIYQLPYLISSLLIFVGFSLVDSFKTALALSYILSGIFMLGFAKEFFKDTKKAFLVTLLYQFAPFRLIEILVRGSFGEVYAYAFLPLVLWGIVLIFKKQNYWHFLLTSFAVAFLILSHNAISLVFFIICFGFILVFAQDKKKSTIAIVSLVFGLFISAFYWIPAIFEHKYTYGDLFMKNLYLTHFPPIQNFFIPNFFNSQNLQTGGISVQFGLFHTIIIFIAIFVLSKYKKIVTFCLILTLASLFFMSPISKPVWGNISLLRQFQFPWRLLSVIAFSTSIMSVCLFAYRFFNKRLIYFSFLFMIVVSTVFYWKSPLGLDKINEKYYWNFPLNTTYFGETDVIWSEGPAKSYPKSRVDVIDGKAILGPITKKSNSQAFTVNAETPIKLVDHTVYFPGWRVYVDGKTSPIEFQYGNYRGQIVFKVPQGEHFIKLSFGESPVRFLSDSISIASLVFLLILGFIKKFSLWE